MDEKKLEIYYDHYKDTFQQQVRYIENRNRYFFISLGLVGLLFVLITDPTTVNNAANGFAQKNVSEKFVFDFGYVNHFILFGLLCVLILYFQVNLTIEKHYEYLWKLENDLTNELQPLSITREGKFYLKVKPTFLKWVSKIYKFFYPISIIFAIVVKLLLVIQGQSFKSLSFWVDLVLCLIIIAITSLYCYWQNIERKKK